MKVRLWLLTTVSSVALAAGANAADLPVKAPSLYSPEPVSNWTGFYGGIHGGAGRLNFDIVTVDEAGICGDGPGGTCSSSASGAIFGGQIGYNYQMRHWVWGIEADASWTNISNTVTDGFAAFKGGIDWLASLRARGGIALDDTYIYLTGGVAAAGLNSGWGYGYASPLGCPCDQVVKDTKFGWVVGAGVEHMLTQHISVKGEALYYDFGTINKSFVDPGTGNTYRSQFSHEVIVGRLGLNYKW
jgi:outer membrane immunogenic protein